MVALASGLYSVDSPSFLLSEKKGKGGTHGKNTKGPKYHKPNLNAPPYPLRSPDASWVASRFYLRFYTSVLASLWFFISDSTVSIWILHSNLKKTFVEEKQKSFVVHT